MHKQVYGGCEVDDYDDYDDYDDFTNDDGDESMRLVCCRRENIENFGAMKKERTASAQYSRFYLKKADSEFSLRENALRAPDTSSGS